MPCTWTARNQQQIKLLCIAKGTIHDALGLLAAGDHAAVLTDQEDEDAYSWYKRP